MHPRPAGNTQEGWSDAHFFQVNHTFYIGVNQTGHFMSLRQIFVTQAMWDDHEERGGAALQELPWRQLSAQIARQLCLWDRARVSARRKKVKVIQSWSSVVLGVSFTFTFHNTLLISMSSGNPLILSLSVSLSIMHCLFPRRVATYYLLPLSHPFVIAQYGQ